MFAASQIAYQKTNSFSRIVIDYLEESELLKNFYLAYPGLEGVKKAVLNRKETRTDREILVTVLKQQYAGLDVTKSVNDNIEKLESADCFTITTAHQPNLFTGPLYFIYKILHAIKLCDCLRKELPAYDFVPVYYMGSEDADFAELNHTYVDGKKIEWKKNQGGAVGRMLADESLEALITELEGQVSVDRFGKEFTDMLRRSYSRGKTIQQATLELLNELFGQYGLVVLIPDHPVLKKQMAAIFRDDLVEHKPASLVAGTSKKLEKHYPVQAHAREINLFYLDGHTRERIEKKGADYHVVNTELKFSEEELLAMIDSSPEKFSPNVILRGLYQEIILPNIIFIGGGGELAYWLQFKDLFDHYKIPYPVLVLRNSFLVIEKKWEALINKLGLSQEELFLDENSIMKLIVERKSANDTALNGNFEKAEELFQSLSSQAATIDPTLVQHVAALRKRSIKTLEELEKKMLRAEKRKFSDQQRQLQNLKLQLFPLKGLQERVENISGLYAKWGPGIIQQLYDHSLCFEQKFTVLTEQG